MSRPAFGLNRHDWSSPLAFAADVARAERLGWDWALIPVNPLGQWDPYVLLALAAGTTSRIGLGTLLENVALDNPASIACSMSTVAELAPDRALLALGIGDTAVRFQNREPATVAELRLATELIRRWLAGDAVDLGARRPAVLRHARPVPVWVAAGGPRTLRMAGATADGVFIRVGRHPDNLRYVVDQVHAGARDAGRDSADVQIGLIFHTITSDGPDEVAAIARCMAAGYYEYSPRLFDIPGFLWTGPHPDELKKVVEPDFHHVADPVAAGRLLTFLDDETAASFSLSGSAEEIADQINETLTLGFRVDIVVPHPVPMPVAHTAMNRRLPEHLSGSDYLAWFAAEVIPRVGY
jgi:5,10-methylenetetrahydromethanopterin reductase